MPEYAKHIKNIDNSKSDEDANTHESSEAKQDKDDNCLKKQWITKTS